jgi:hypothetical protein
MVRHETDPPWLARGFTRPQAEETLRSACHALSQKQKQLQEAQPNQILPFVLGVFLVRPTSGGQRGAQVASRAADGTLTRASNSSGWCLSKALLAESYAPGSPEVRRRQCKTNTAIFALTPFLPPPLLSVRKVVFEHLIVGQNMLNEDDNDDDSAKYVNFGAFDFSATGPIVVGGGLFVRDSDVDTAVYET